MSDSGDARVSPSVVKISDKENLVASPALWRAFARLRARGLSLKILAIAKSHPAAVNMSVSSEDRKKGDALCESTVFFSCLDGFDFPAAAPAPADDDDVVVVVVVVVLLDLHSLPKQRIIAAG